jgi:hypothetical protein
MSCSSTSSSPRRPARRRETTLDDEILDRIDEIVPPGTEIVPLDMSHTPPALPQASLQRRPPDERVAA